VRCPTRATPANVERPWKQTAKLDSLHNGVAATRSTIRAHEQSAAIERFLCEACGDVIGAYEPLVMRTTDNERSTSRAAKPGLRARDAAYFHRECHYRTAG
jgi:hypothetical protein